MKIRNYDDKKELDVSVEDNLETLLFEIIKFSERNSEFKKFLGDLIFSIGKDFEVEPDPILKLEKGAR